MSMFGPNLPFETVNSACPTLSVSDLVADHIQDPSTEPFEASPTSEHFRDMWVAPSADLCLAPGTSIVRGNS